MEANIRRASCGMLAPLAVSYRAGPGATLHPETFHAGVVCAVSADGTETFALGEPAAAFPLRSTAKPFQLLPYLLDGHHRSDRPEDEVLADLAVMAGSHSGAAMHTERVAAVLARAGLDAAALACGAHLPFDAPTREALVRAGAPPSPLHCNCSGKHAAMLSVSRARGWPLDTYLARTHPLQQRIERLLAALAGATSAPLPCTTDGCSLPSFVLPVRALARLYALLAQPDAAPPVEGRPVADELNRIFRAGTRHPALVAGPGCLDTRLMEAFGARLFAKSGAAGLLAMAVRPSPGCPRGLGIAVKVADGDPDTRVRALVATAVLRRLGAVAPEETALAAALEHIAGRERRNLRGWVVGEIRPAFGAEG